MSDTPRPSDKPIDVWMVTDGKAGHENQILGLVERLGAHAPVRSHRIRVRKKTSWPPWGFLTSAGAALPAPDLILCAGRRTHRAALSIKRRRGGVLVVCMRPYVRQSEFDLCLIPAHDGVDPAPNIESTTGGIVNVRPSHHHDERRGLVLVGGPSKHHGIDTDALIERVSHILGHEDSVRWDLTTSRRTPEEAARRLQELHHERLRVTLCDRTPRGWVHERLAESAWAWITEDSVSMICESVTSGCSTGVLPMPRNGDGGRVQRCVEDLTARALVTPFERWRETHELSKPNGSLDEADRCARLILKRFFAARGGDA